MLTVNVPSKFNTKSMYDLIDAVITQDGNPVSKEINFDFKNLFFIEPSGVTVLSNIIEWLRKRDVGVYISTPDSLTVPIKYLDDSGFFERYLKNPLQKQSSLRKTTAPLRLIKHGSSLSWLNNDFKVWMSDNLGLPADCFDDIKTCLKEIFLNIKDHSGENIGCIFMQYFPNNKEISISISDFGEGIPRVVKRQMPFMDDFEAIIKACEKGFSTRSTPQNRGAGLPHLINHIVTHHDGKIAIHSNRGVAQFYPHAVSRIRTEKIITKSSYPGTLFDIVLSTDDGFIRNLREDFEW